MPPLLNLIPSSTSTSSRSIMTMFHWKWRRKTAMRSTSVLFVRNKLPKATYRPLIEQSTPRTTSEWYLYFSKLYEPVHMQPYLLYKVLRSCIQFSYTVPREPFNVFKYCFLLMIGLGECWIKALCLKMR